MTKNNLFKIIAITFLVFMLVGLVFFRKSDDEILNPNPVPADNQQVENPDEKYKLTEEEKLKIFAENFVITYYSYTWGNFSNVESQYCHMTDEMKSREEIKVEKMKREIKGQPQRYFTVQARITSSNFVEYQEDNKASLDVDMRIKEFNGAIIAPKGTEILVDINGNVHEGNAEDLIEKVFDKGVRISLIKTREEWKVDKIRDIE